MNYFINATFFTKMLLVILAVLCIILAANIVIRVMKEVVKRKFSNQYGISKLPKSIKIKKGNKKDYNYYKMKYPYWANSKKDGTADLRVKSNRIVWRNSILYIDKLKLISKYPDDLIYVVKLLREKGVRINLCKEEKAKLSEIKDRKERLAGNSNIQNIINNYEENSTGFEKLCADLFENMGYQAKVTSQSNDGGYDIVLLKNNEAAIVECKCYSLANKVGRPAIQKLVGANKIALADRMIFITTSEFTAYAISYAQKVGVELIDGNKLMQYLNEYMDYGQQGFEVNINECQLEISDLMAYVPSDIYEEYFI